MSFLRSSVAFPIIMYCRILGLIKNIKESCKCETRSEVDNLPSQMERDAVHANKYKADIYSMAKTIWIAFEGQYIPNSVVSLRQYISGDIYLYPLEKNYCHNVQITMETPILMR
ncbi:hypothetical protein HMPREF1981_00470, partial [Bacteroides pyogenes F0041]